MGMPRWKFACLTDNCRGGSFDVYVEDDGGNTAIIVCDTCGAQYYCEDVTNAQPSAPQADTE